MVFLFLLITMIISTVIVFFLTKVRTLEAILERAKEIDRAKEERLAFLDASLSQEKMKSFAQEKDLYYFEAHKEKLQSAKKSIAELQETILSQERKYIDEIHAQKGVLDELKIRYQLLNQQSEKVEEELYLLKQSNEHLLDNNNLLYTQKRELEIKLDEQYKQMNEKMQMMENHRGDLKEEFAELATKIFESNS